MDIKERLKQIEVANRMIENKQEEIQRLHDLATKITVGNTGERVRKTSNNDKMADLICSAADLEIELEHDVNNYVNLRKNVMKEIDSLENIDMIDIMYKRYFQCKKWEKIAEELHMSYRNVIRLHNRALEKLENSEKCH